MDEGAYIGDMESNLQMKAKADESGIWVSEEISCLSLIRIRWMIRRSPSQIHGTSAISAFRTSIHLP